MSAVSLRYVLLARVPRASTADSQRKTENQFDRAVSVDQYPVGKEAAVFLRLHVDRWQSIRYDNGAIGID